MSQNEKGNVVSVSHTEHVQRRQFRWYNVGVILAMSFASISMGYSASVIGTTLAQPSFIGYFELATRPDATTLLSTMNGLFQAGCFLGSLLISPMADHLGRKAAISFACGLVLISGACLAGAVNFNMFLAFRFFAGTGSWMLLGAVPVWMTEVVPPKNRGLLVDIHSTALLFGYFLASWVGYGFYTYSADDATNTTAWRGPFGIQCLPALILLSVVYWLPESPRWLVQRGRHEEARQVLAKLHDADEAAIEYKEIESQLQIDNSLPSSWISMITKPSYRKRTILAVGLAIGIQFTGVLVINNYGTIIYKTLGFDTKTQLVYQAGFNTVAFGCGVIAMFIVDLFPRNKLVAVGTALVTTCLVAEAGIVANDIGPDANPTALRAGAAMAFCYIALAELLLDGTQYVYFAEMFPSHLRAKGLTIGMASIALINVVWLQTAPTAFENISWKFYLVFIIPAYLFAIVCWFLYPDTKGLALEEIAAIFGDDTAVYRVGDTISPGGSTSGGVHNVQVATKDAEKVY